MFLLYMLIFATFVPPGISFFFGPMMGGGCNCPPAPSCGPPPACAAPPPPPACGGGDGGFQGFPGGPLPGPLPLYRPQQPQPFYPQNNNGGAFIGGGGGGGQYAQAPQILPSLQLGQGAPPAPAAPPGYQPRQGYNQAPLPPPPPPPPVRPEPPSPYNQHGESNSNLFSEYDEKISVEPAERTYSSPTPPSNYIDTDAKSPSHHIHTQVEVMPSPKNEETSYKDKDLEEGFDFEIQQKPIKKIMPETTSSSTGMTMKSTTMIRTTIPPISLSTTTLPTLVTTTTAGGDLYDDDTKLPEIDQYYENSSNKTKSNKVFKNDALSNDYSDNSFRTKAAGVKSRVANENDKDVKCGNESLRKIMMENIVSSPTISKQLIFSAGKQQFQKLIDVVCSRNKFSYTVVSSQIYCEVTKAPVTCFAFFQP